MNTIKRYNRPAIILPLFWFLSWMVAIIDTSLKLTGTPVPPTEPGDKYGVWIPITIIGFMAVSMFMGYVLGYDRHVDNT